MEEEETRLDGNYLASDSSHLGPTAGGRRGERHRPGQLGWGILRKVVMHRGREGLRLEWQPSLNLELESRATEQKPDSGLAREGGTG